VAIGLTAGVIVNAHDLGTLVADLARAGGCAVDLVLLEDAPPPCHGRGERRIVGTVNRTAADFQQPTGYPPRGCGS